MYKIIIVLMILLSSACITHKDLAQVEANAYEKVVEYHQRQKIEYYVQQQVNRFFKLSRLFDNTPHAELLDVSIISEVRGNDLTIYECDIVMISGYHPHVKAKMIIEVYDEYSGIGKFGMTVNPWYDTEIE